MGSRKRRVHKQIFEATQAFSSTTTDPEHQELTEGFCYQVIFGSAGVTQITFSLEGSVDYDLVANGSETWQEIQSQTCDAASGSFFFNVNDVYIPYFRIVATVQAGSNCDTLKIYKYSRETT